MSLKKLLINKGGHFGQFGGCYVPELLIPIMEDLKKEFFQAIKDPQFLQKLHEGYRDYIGRPSPLYHCKGLTSQLGGAQIYIKNEGHNLTGAHKINHCLGQALLAKRLGKTRIIAETGAGQHGLATATVCAKLNLQCTIYMGAKDYKRQAPNVFWMEKLGATVTPVQEGGQILRDAINAALRDLIGNPHDTHYLLGTVCGPHPYPVMNTFFQKIIGEEIRNQMKEKIGALPDVLVACIGGGSNAMGMFYDFLDKKSVQLIGVEAEGAARFHGGSVGVAEGFKSYFIQDQHGQLQETSSISAGLDYSGVGPQITYLTTKKRLQMAYATDKEVLKAHAILANTEGIFPALESAHAVAHAIKLAPTLSPKKHLIINLSGRGDKDLFILNPNL